ncbi:CBS domain protein [Saccharothrix carnea]|uniref:CBS domain protein n=1 Tax=Saccharothrix carnea TaxID=1280637 RepID=A0A2P8ID05_SACCR|nr:CBS domain-containing protein [Saccharothrix carnea]PSL56345.1 CBS domain protein [Saccharothrix carnea]
MRIADVLRNKGSAVATVESRASVADLVAALAEHNVGAMVVLGPEGISGIVSERDVVRKLHDRGGELLSAPVSEIMTSEVFTCTPRDSVDSLTVLMTERRIRHVPVVDGGELVGIVSIGDVVKSRINQLQEDHDQLTAYIVQG